MADKRTYVRGLIAEIFEKDIRRRLKIRNKSTFETVRTYIINNFGATTSLNGLRDALVKNGTPVTEATVSRYIRHINLIDFMKDGKLF